MDKRQKKIEETIEKLLSSNDHNFVLKTILDHLQWPVGLENGIQYFVNEDDTDGARRGIGVHFLDNGDGVIDFKECMIESHFAQSEISTTPHVYRFRNWCGGGRSLYVHKALLILAHAVMIDKDEEVIIPSINEKKEPFIIACSPDCEECLNDNHEYKKLIHDLSLIHLEKSTDPSVLCSASFKDFDRNHPDYQSYSRKQSLIFEIAKKHQLPWVLSIK